MRGRTHGFTLIEILVAVVIIGIVMSVAVLSLSLAGDDREVRKEVRRLMSLIEVAQTDAMMQGREFGIEIMTGAYRFVEFDVENNRWVEPLGDDSLKLWQLPEDYEVTLYVDDKRILLDPEPKIAIHRSSTCPTCSYSRAVIRRRSNCSSRAAATVCPPR